MSDLAAEISNLRREVCALAQLLSPYIDQSEMQTRYGVTSKTLLAMERRGEIPERVKGRWVRAEVVQWEAHKILTQNA